MTLSETAPEVWREVIIDADLPLSTLHRVMQLLFGWDDARPAQFHTSPPRGPFLVRAPSEPVEPNGAIGRSVWSSVEHADVEVAIAEPERDPGPPLPIKATVEQALRDGMLWYSYGHDHEWMVALELLESAPAEGPQAPVLLVSGSARGPYRFSPDPIDYHARAALFADVNHPDHPATHIRLDQEEGLWAPLHPSFFDAAAMQSELNLLMDPQESRPDGAAPQSPAMGLEPGSPLPQLIDGLPERNASDVRMHLLREGLLEEILAPDALSANVVEDIAHPFRVMLEALGESGAPLRWYDKALPESAVRRVMRELGTWKLCHDCLGNEQRAWPARRLREQMVRMRLVRVYKGRLVPIKAAWQRRDEARALSGLVARRVFEKIDWPYRLPAFAVALTIADRTEVEAAGVGATFAFASQFPFSCPDELGSVTQLQETVDRIREALCFSDLCRSASRMEPFSGTAGPGSLALARAALRSGHQG